MPVQETVTKATANLSGSAAAVLIAAVAVAVLALGAETFPQLFDVDVPWRQLVIGRSLNALMLSWRCLYTIVGSYLTAAFSRNQLTASRQTLPL